MDPGEILAGSYDRRAVTLSILISILGAYAVLDLAERMSVVRGGARLAWLVGGGLASGINSWSMHYTAMLAFILPVPVRYHWPTVMLSLFPAAFGAGLALVCVSARTIRGREVLAASILLGSGIAALHYTAMQSMRLAAMHRYALAVVVVSVIVPIVVSLLALREIFLSPPDARWPGLRRAAGVLLLGAANPAMHYTAMAGTSFVRAATPPDVTGDLDIAAIGAVAITIIPAMVIAVTLFTTLVDRLREQRALLDELFEEAPHAIALMRADDRVVRVNREFTRVFGYTLRESIGRELADLIGTEEPRGDDQRSVDPGPQGQRGDAEGVRRRKDGSRLHVSMVRVRVAARRSPVTVSAIFRDVTERKRAEEMLQGFSQRLIDAQEAERRRIARELHDELGQVLTAMKINLGNVQHASGASPLVRQLDETVELIDSAIGQVRELALDLRPSILDDLGLVAALHWYVDREARRAGLTPEIRAEDVDVRDRPHLETASFRIAQEAIANVVRHARASRVWVEVRQGGGHLELTIGDDGIGFDVPALGGRRGAEISLGLLGMQERALLVGAHLEIRSTPGRTEIHVRFPL
jgi:PAS domain S-box-containing protein